MVAESGIHKPEDIRLLQQAGVNAILVGEALVSAQNIAAAVQQMSGRKAEQA